MFLWEKIDHSLMALGFMIAAPVLWVIGLPTTMLGIMLISLAFRLRGLLRKVKTTSAAGA